MGRAGRGEDAGQVTRVEVPSPALMRNSGVFLLLLLPSGPKAATETMDTEGSE